MDQSYIEELIKEYEGGRDRALSKVMSPDTKDVAEYSYWKGRYATFKEVANNLRNRHAID